MTPPRRAAFAALLLATSLAFIPRMAAAQTAAPEDRQHPATTQQPAAGQQSDTNPARQRGTQPATEPTRNPEDGAGPADPNRFVRLGDVTALTPLPHGVEVRAGAAAMRVEALRDDILRVRITPDGRWQEDASWAVLPERRAGETPGLAGGAHVTPASDGFTTPSLKVRIERTPLRLVVLDASGNVITEDAPGRPATFTGRRDLQGGQFRVWKTLRSDEHFFGLGDKAGPLDRRDQAFDDWNTDAFGFQESTDPLYKSIPFFVGESGGRYYGVFLDNTWRASFDFGRASRSAYSFGSDGGPLDYYLFAGPTPRQVIEAYAWLTGPSPLPPLWSLGYQQSRYSYAPESVVRDIATHLRADRIPSDVLWLDIDYQYKNRPFTVDPQAFPDMPKLVAELRAQHFHTVAITDLHIADLPNAGYSPYNTGVAADAFVKNPDGSTFVGVVWPGNSVFPDFTRAPIRVWWGDNYKQFVRWGLAGFWNDMNEPSVFNGPGKTMPLDTVHRIEGSGFSPRTASHREIHNVYGMQNARATFEGMLRLAPDERPFVMTRASYAGGQRYSVTWTGDNSSTWNHLRLSSTMLENLGLSGYAFAGADVGGYAGSPQPDLLTRWLQLAAFQPIDRDHTAKGTNPQEPWVNGPEQEAIRRHFIEIRYRLLPYLYTLAEETSRTGLPMMRPLFLEFPDATQDKHPVDLDASGEFLLGPNLLIAPAPYPDMMDTYIPTLPATEWYNFWTGAKIPRLPSLSELEAKAQASPDGTTMQSPAMKQLMDQIRANTVAPRLDQLPVYVRSGSILPMQPLVQSTDETPSGPLQLHVYPGPDCRGSLYSDDGHTLRYQHGDFVRIAYACTPAANGLNVTLGPHQGPYTPWWKQVELVVYGWPSASATVSVAQGPSSAGSATDSPGASISNRDGSRPDGSKVEGSAQKGAAASPRHSPSTTYDAVAHALHLILDDPAQGATVMLTHP